MLAWPGACGEMQIETGLLPVVREAPFPHATEGGGPAVIGNDGSKMVLASPPASCVLVLAADQSGLVLKKISAKIVRTGPIHAEPSVCLASLVTLGMKGL